MKVPRSYVARSYVESYSAAIPIFGRSCRYLGCPLYAMAADARDTRIAELEAEIKELRRLLASAENRAADDALATAQRSIQKRMLAELVMRQRLRK
jgi:hypothetical protein